MLKKWKKTEKLPSWALREISRKSWKNKWYLKGKRYHYVITRGADGGLVAYRAMNPRFARYVRRRRMGIIRKVSCLIMMAGVSYSFIYGMEWAFGQGGYTFFGYPFLPYLILVVCHELLHALAWWYYGCFAIPIPIMVPPIMGITIGPALRGWRNATVALAPILLTITSLHLGYYEYAMLNFFGMTWDIGLAFTRW